MLARDAADPKGCAFDNLSRSLASHRMGITMSSVEDMLADLVDLSPISISISIMASLNVTLSGIKGLNLYCILPRDFNIQ